MPPVSPVQEALLKATLAKNKLVVQELRKEVTQTLYDALKAWATGHTPSQDTQATEQFSNTRWEQTEPLKWTWGDAWSRSSFGNRRAAWNWIQDTWHERERQTNLLSYLDARDLPGLADWCQTVQLAPFEAIHGIRMTLAERGPFWTETFRQQAMAVLTPLARTADLLNLVFDTTVHFPDESAERFFFDLAKTHAPAKNWPNHLGRLITHALFNLNEPSVDRLLTATHALSAPRQKVVRFLWVTTLLDLSDTDQTVGMDWLIRRGHVSVADGVQRLLRRWEQRAEAEGRSDPSVQHELVRMDRLGQWADPKELGRIRQAALPLKAWDELPLTQAKWQAFRRQRMPLQQPPLSERRPRMRT